MVARYCFKHDSLNQDNLCFKDSQATKLKLVVINKTSQVSIESIEIFVVTKVTNER